MSVNEPTGEKGTQESNLAEEVREFGRQLTAVLRTVRESPRAREIEQQVTSAMRDVERQVNEALGTARDKTQPQQLKETIKGTATYAADEMQRGLARGLHGLNERIARAVQEAESSRAESDVSARGSSEAAARTKATAGGGSSGFGGEVSEADRGWKDTDQGKAGAQTFSASEIGTDVGSIEGRDDKDMADNPPWRPTEGA